MDQVLLYLFYQIHLVSTERVANIATSLWWRDHLAATIVVLDVGLTKLTLMSVYVLKTWSGILLWQLIVSL